MTVERALNMRWGGLRLLILVLLASALYGAGVLTAYQGSWVGWSQEVTWTYEKDSTGKVVNAYETHDRWEADRQFYLLSTCRKWVDSMWADNHGPTKRVRMAQTEYTCLPFKQRPPTEKREQTR